MLSKSRSAANRKILTELIATPTAPFAEHFAIEVVEKFCHRLGRTAVTRDAAGNVLVRLRQGRNRTTRPVCITAHLDHPGFVADRMLSANRLRAFWRGGVSPDYFIGGRVRLWTNGRWVRGKVASVKTNADRGRRRVDTAIITVPRPVPKGAIGMWDFPDFTLRNGRVYARVCDDLAGAAAILCCIDALIHGKSACDAYFLFTRAEEVGFVGAIAAARAVTIPKKCMVVAMETSAERLNAKLGDGPILRVGDRSTIFTPEATAYCERVAADLAKRNRRFKFQRKLMDGGTCESSAFRTLGYDTTGICVALGNYHNMNPKRKRLGPEYIDLNDFDNVVAWFIELCRASIPYTGKDEKMLSELVELERKYARLLHQTVTSPK